MICEVCPKTIVSGLSRSQRQRNMIITLTSEMNGIPLMHSRGADLTPARSKSKPPIETNQSEFENLMTLKQACSSEYQGAQGAFKDSMIH